MIQILPTLFLFLLFGFFMYLALRSKRKKAERSLRNSESELASLRSKVMVVTANSIPGKEIKNVLGTVSGTSSTSASTPAEAEAAEKEALVLLMKNAVEMGANSVIDLKMTTSSYEQQGSKWMVSKIFYYGTAVNI